MRRQYVVSFSTRPSPDKRKSLNGGELNGPAILPRWSSLIRARSITLGEGRQKRSWESVLGNVAPGSQFGNHL